MGPEVVRLFAIVVTITLLTATAREDALSTAPRGAPPAADSEEVQEVDKTKEGVAGAISSISNIRDGQKLIQAETDIQGEDVDNLRQKITTISDDVKDKERMERLVQDIQSDAATSVVGDLQNDASYENQVRTHTSVALQRDVKLLKAHAGHVLEDVQRLKGHKKWRNAGTTKKRKQKQKKEDRHNDPHNKTTAQPDKSMKMPVDRPAVSPLLEDVAVDDAPYRETSEALTIARPRSDNFNLSWLSRYLQACPQCTVFSQDKRCPMIDQALEMQKWASALQDILTNGCIKPDICNYPSTCCIAPDVTIQQTLSTVARTLKELYDMLHRACTSCPTETWSEWSAWSSCDATCGRGTRSRFRRCSLPSGNCPGSAREWEQCPGNPPCCDASWGAWLQWSRCSASCGWGMKERRRQCDSPSSNDCPSTCQGNDRDQERCTIIPCEICVHGGWSDWESWGACSVSCGRGKMLRRRRCNSPPPNHCGQSCAGPREDEALCESRVDGSWGMWSAWTSCSSLCGEGRRSRHRTCSNPPHSDCGRECPGDARQFETCVNQPQIDGNWSPWQPWSACSATCGQGQQSRRRACNNPKQNECGTPCQGPEAGHQPCDPMLPCCVDGHWSPWQPWSDCSVTCGRGVNSRRRLCNNPPANECGRNCQGRDFQHESCGVNVPCCIDGNWSPWQSWSACSVTCGQGMSSRRRLCNNPPANQCGLPCQGRDFEDGPCNTNVPCVICVDGHWSPWQAWSDCSVTCGRGVNSRQRLCNNPPANECGRNCQGRDFEQESCGVNVPCCMDGNWGQWQPWSVCSVTCGRGTIERRRSCDSPPANQCGQSCPGKQFETELCDMQECRESCVPRSWSQWQPWTRCSVSCGQGLRQRERSCEEHPYNSCPNGCPGSPTMTDVCDSGVSVDGAWGNWQAWSLCSVSCGSGRKERSRSCDSPPANRCGRSCIGNSYENNLCDTGVPCIQCVDGQWSPWSNWSPCSVSCGIGSILRSRTCTQPPANYCGAPCPGQTDERVTCAGTGLCNCARVQWGPWNPWGPCSATCGIAYRSRVRQCVVAERGIDCGDRCTGSDQSNEQCEGHPSCPWGVWSACSVTCRGQGKRERIIATVIIPGRGDVTVETNATRKEIEDCVVEEPECPSWAEWSACSATCRGEGYRERIITSFSISETTTGNVRTNATRKEVEACMAAGPECPSWSEWSACSVTCKGEGVRERIIMSFSNVETGVGTNATRKEVETCVVNEPECPYGDVNWASWDSWCPCDCKQGVRTRRRDCQRPSLIGTGPLIVPIAMCQGEGRQEERCDARIKCPECVTDCQGLEPGDYPSCMECSFYLSCRGNQLMTPFSRCGAGEEWDAFVKKCVPAPSPSCSLHDCVSDCTAVPDGLYHSCAGCSSYTQCSAGRTLQRMCSDQLMEWNQHNKQCEANRSPTCRRLTLAYSFIPGAGLQRDAPETKVTDKTQDILSVSSKLEPQSSETQVKHSNKSSVIANCRTHCRDVQRGKYPSCRGCGYYVICTKHHMLYQRQCSGSKQWDDTSKSCKQLSKTCSQSK